MLRASRQPQAASSKQPIRQTRESIMQGAAAFVQLCSGAVCAFDTMGTSSILRVGQHQRGQNSQDNRA